LSRLLPPLPFRHRRSRHCPDGRYKANIDFFGIRAHRFITPPNYTLPEKHISAGADDPVFIRTIHICALQTSFRMSAPDKIGISKMIETRWERATPGAPL
jgi:hypothetical protein